MICLSVCQSMPKERRFNHFKSFFIVKNQESYLRIMIITKIVKIAWLESLRLNMKKMIIKFSDKKCEEIGYI